MKEDLAYLGEVLNVFYLDDSPVAAAQMHPDFNLRRALPWAGTILSTVWWNQSGVPEGEKQGLYCEWGPPMDQPIQGEFTSLNTLLNGQRIYRPFSKTHPCVQWAGLYGGNYVWLYRLACALLDEYKYRFDATHCSLYAIRALELVPPALVASLDTWCESPAVMPESFTVEGDTAKSYCRYVKSQSGKKYTRRSPPEWVNLGE